MEISLNLLPFNVILHCGGGEKDITVSAKYGEVEWWSLVLSRNSWKKQSEQVNCHTAETKP
jgi:hypothetical protein